MKIALVCPSNMLYMPYVNNYIKILDEINADYSIINWDRFQIEDPNEFKYRDKKIGHQRNFYDYLKYKRFLLKNLEKHKFDKVIVFGLQLAYFLKVYLLENYQARYVIDIRDYNRIIKFFRLRRLIESSFLTVISSPGYKAWLPKSEKYIVNHNMSVDSWDDTRKITVKIPEKDRIKISYIGSLRDYKINVEFINSLKNSNQFKLIFHGEGIINQKLKLYIESKNLEYVDIIGRYKKEDELKLYNVADIINVILPNTDINSKTLLPNRLYNSALAGKPIIGFRGTYLAEQICKYKLGLVLDSFDRVDEKIKNYLLKFCPQDFAKKRKTFLHEVINENAFFRLKIEEFINNYTQ